MCGDIVYYGMAMWRKILLVFFIFLGGRTLLLHVLRAFSVALLNPLSER